MSTPKIKKIKRHQDLDGYTIMDATLRNCKLDPQLPGTIGGAMTPESGSSAGTSTTVVTSINILGTDYERYAEADRASEGYYAWKNGETIIYTDTIAPEVGDITYTDELSPSGDVIESVESTTTYDRFLLQPNTLHVWEEVTSLVLGLGESAGNAPVIHTLQFKTGASAPTIVWPEDIMWANGTVPTINTGKTYEVSICENLAVVMEFAEAE